MRVWVARLPGLYSIPLRVKDTGLMIDFGRPTPFFFYEQVLKAEECLTQRREEASVVFIPTSGDRWYTRDRVGEYMDAVYPDVWRNESVIKVWAPMVDDAGAGVYFPGSQPKAPFIPSGPGWDSSVFLVNNGLLEGSTRAAECVGTFRVGTDIVIPPYPKSPFDIVVPLAPNVTRRGRAPTLFFSGSIVADTAWSMEDGNARYALLLAARDDPSLDIVAESVMDFPARMRDAQFCLAPPGKGGGWGIRGYMAIAAGCIPVFVDVDRAHMFDEILDVTSFAIVLGLESVIAEPAGVGRVLRGVEVGDRERMRREVGCLRRVVLYEEEWVWRAVLEVVRARARARQRQRQRPRQRELELELEGDREDGGDGRREEGGGEGKLTPCELLAVLGR